MNVCGLFVWCGCGSVCVCACPNVSVWMDGWVGADANVSVCVCEMCVCQDGAILVLPVSTEIIHSTLVRNFLTQSL